MNMRFTDRTVHSLPHPKHGQREYADDAIHGLSIVVGKTTKSFRLTIGTGEGRKRFALGRYPILTLAIAREKARDIIAKERLAPTDTPRTTFAEAARLYDKLHLATLRPASARDVRRSLTCNFAKLSRMQLTEITRRDITPLLDQMNATPQGRDAAFRHIRAFFRWCLERGYIERVPTDQMHKPKRCEARSRVLSPEELVRIWHACPDTDYGRIVRLCILSGQRRGQWGGMRREYIKGDFITWPREAMKMEKAHLLPLTPAVRVLLPDRIGYLFPTAGGVPFNNWAACKERLDEDSGVSDWRHHDLRRTWATISAEEIGTEWHVIETVLAHAVGTQVARTYNRARFIEPMKKALLAFEDWLQTLLSNTERNNGAELSGLHHQRA
jgi:integrase